MFQGFIRVASVAPRVHLADVEANVNEILTCLDKSRDQGAEITLFPEMSLTGYTCGDLFHNQSLLGHALDGLKTLVNYSRGHKDIFIVGLPVSACGKLYNCAAIIADGEYKLVAKANVPNYNEFYECRYWTAVPEDQVVTDGDISIYPPQTVFSAGDVKYAVEICEDLWVASPPSAVSCRRGAEIVFNLSASPDQIGKYDYLLDLLRQQSARCLCAYVYASAGWGESSTDLAFDGKAIIAECGKILAKNHRFDPGDNIAIADIDLLAIRRDRLHTTTFNSLNFTPVKLGMIETPNVAETLKREIDTHPFVPSDMGHRRERCREITAIQTAGLARRLDAIGCKSLVVGISGGLDSTLALLIAVKAFDRLGISRSGIIGVTMPGFGTTGRTHGNAVKLMQLLGVTVREIPIGPAVERHFADIGHDPSIKDTTYENSQARERTQILMDVANQTGGIVLGTGDLSELALGWATYNGDHMSMYGVNAGVPKTLVSHLVRWFADEDEGLKNVLYDIIDTPISPELIPADEHGEIKQKTEDLVGPYELHDFFLYYMLRYGFAPGRVLFLANHAFRGKYAPDIIKKWLKVFYRRFFSQQFKRSCLPDGPKVGSVCLSPRGDWRMPSDASAKMWLAEL